MNLMASLSMWNMKEKHTIHPFQPIKRVSEGGAVHSCKSRSHFVFIAMQVKKTIIENLCLNFNSSTKVMSHFFVCFEICSKNIILSLNGWTVKAVKNRLVLTWGWVSVGFPGSCLYSLGPVEGEREGSLLGCQPVGGFLPSMSDLKLSRIDIAPLFTFINNNIIDYKAPSLY